jgi:hypothetical protein
MIISIINSFIPFYTTTKGKKTTFRGDSGFTLEGRRREERKTY